MLKKIATLFLAIKGGPAIVRVAFKFVGAVFAVAAGSFVLKQIKAGKISVPELVKKAQ